MKLKTALAPIVAILSVALVASDASAFYASHMGRWVTRDPEEYQGSTFNLYEYVEGRPIVLTDSSGLMPGSYVPGMGVNPAIMSTPPPPCGDLEVTCKTGSYTIPVYEESPTASLVIGNGCVTFPWGIYCSMSCEDIKNAYSGDNPNRTLLDHEACHACAFLDGGLWAYVGTIGFAPDPCCGNERPSTPLW
jgi:hypothetical protein